MDNGLTFEQYVGKISDLYEIDKAFVLAIINLESGYQSSYLFTNMNNVGGHRGLGGTWKSYTTLEAGVLAHVLSVKNIADKNNIDAKEMTNEEETLCGQPRACAGSPRDGGAGRLHRG